MSDVTVSVKFDHDEVLGAVAEKAAVQFARGLSADDVLSEAKAEARRAIVRVRADVIRELVTPIIAEAINGPVFKTNTYGEPMGGETTVRDLIAEEVKVALRSPSGATRSDARPTILGEIIRLEVDRALRDELSAAVKEAKAEVIKAVRDQASAELAKRIASGT